MGPRIKRNKSQHQPHASSSSTSKSTNSTEKEPETDTDSKSPKSDKPSGPQTWYKAASWRAKASPVTQATCESISVAGGATTEALAEGAGQVGRYMHNSLKRRSTKSIPSLPSESRINATRSSSELKKTADSKHVVVASPTVVGDDVETKAADTKTADTGAADTKIADSKATDTKAADSKAMPQEPAEDAPLPPNPSKDGVSQADSSSQRPWFGWWSRPDGYKNEQHEKAASPDMAQAQKTPLPATPAPAPALTNPLEDPALTSNKPTTPPIPIDNPPNKPDNTTSADPPYGSTRSWFGLWSKAQNNQPQPDESSTMPEQSPPEASPPPEPPVIQDPQPAENTPVKNTSEMQQIGESPPQPKSAGWAFWSRENKNAESATPNGTERQIGELAVADTPSQSHPEAAQFNQNKDQETAAKQKQKLKTKTPSKLNRVSHQESTPATPPRSPPTSRSATPDIPKPPEDAKPSDAPTASVQQVMPSFRDTYSPAETPTYWERVTQYVATSLHIVDNPPPKNHVAISPTFPKVKNAVAIGVHGYFPAPLVQKVLGPPTGTSIRFAKHASTAIRKWVEANQPETPCDIETVALEGEGFIADRVSTLWKLLLNWLSHLRQADLIFVACHSQGVPVAIMLVSKLIQLGCLSAHVKVGICAMAGVNLGPFADYKSRLLGAGSAAELFELGRPTSKVSTEYATALDVVLRHSVRITYVGSIDDQLVSLESSTFATLTHPYIYRAVYVDPRIHAPDFITHLVSFVLKLRNLGISDHNLLRELSLPLAGSLYGGQGHSTVYDSDQVYHLALSFCLETTDIPAATHTPTKQDEAQARRSARGGPPSSVTAANALRRGSVSASNVTGTPPTFAPFTQPASGRDSNPYFLPWALRGILEEDLVKSGFRDEVLDLVQKFEDWKPQSKVLKDVRWRLEGVRGSYGSHL